MLSSTSIDEMAGFSDAFVERSCSVENVLSLWTLLVCKRSLGK